MMTIKQIDRDIAELEALKPRAIGCDLYDGMVVCGGEMSSRIVAAGIASLIAQLEQQRADLELRHRPTPAELAPVVSNVSGANDYTDAIPARLDHNQP